MGDSRRNSCMVRVAEWLGDRWSMHMGTEVSLGGRRVFLMVHT